MGVSSTIVGAKDTTQKNSRKVERVRELEMFGIMYRQEHQGRGEEVIPNSHPIYRFGL